MGYSRWRPPNQNIGGDVSPASPAGLTPVLWFFKDILSHEGLLSAVSIHFRKQSNRLHRMFCGSAWLGPEMHFNAWKKNFVIYILSTICHNWPALMGFYFLTSLASCQCTSLLLLLLFWYMTNKFFFFFNVTYKPTNRHHHHQHHHIKLKLHDKRVCLSISATYRVLSIYWTTCNKRTCKIWL